MSLLEMPSSRLLERSLDASTLRQKVIANNIANVDTPYFKRSDVRFEDLLQDELNRGMTIQSNRTDPRHFRFGTGSPATPQVVEDNSSVMNNNMNNVDIDSEMSAMAENQLRYNTYIQQVNEQLRMLRTAITGGK